MRLESVRKANFCYDWREHPTELSLALEERRIEEERAAPPEAGSAEAHVVEVQRAMWQLRGVRN